MGRHSPGPGERCPHDRCYPSSSSTPASEQTQDIIQINAFMIQIMHHSPKKDLLIIHEINVHLIMSSSSPYHMTDEFH